MIDEEKKEVIVMSRGRGKTAYLRYWAPALLKNIEKSKNDENV